jgi:UDP-N-acetylmuramyl pentapeptide synthase
VSVVTTVAAVHTEFLGSLDGVREEKADLVRALGPDGFAVLNADDPRVASMAADTPARVITFGQSDGAMVRTAGDAAETAEGLRFTLEIAGARAPVLLAFAGRHNVGNALAAAGAGLALGLGIDEIARGLADARPVKGRCVWRQAGDVRLLDDTYNANPASVRAAFETAAAHRGTRRLVIVLGDMLELGETTEQAHRDAGRQVVEAGAAEFIGMGRHAEIAVDAARAAGLSGALHTTTFEDTVAHLLKRLAPGDLVLVKGSRGMRMERVADALVARLGRTAGA